MLTNALDMTPRLRRYWSHSRPRSPYRVAFATSAWGQSFLGTIRGTVTDPQGQSCQGAAVLIIDESTGARARWIPTRRAATKRPT